MSDYKKKTELLIEELTIRYPDFKIKFKDESKFMKALNVFVGLFNKSFMTRFTTVLGYTIYFPSREKFESDWRSTFYTLAHESIHMANHDHNPIKHVLGYSFPQNLTPLAMLAFLAFIHPAFLVFLVFLLALGPWPAPFRVKEETYGYGMNCKIAGWEGIRLSDEDLKRRADTVCGWGYYNPLYPKDGMIKNLRKYNTSDDAVLPRGYEIIKRIYFIDYYANL